MSPIGFLIIPGIEECNKFTYWKNLILIGARFITSQNNDKRPILFLIWKFKVSKD